MAGRPLSLGLSRRAAKFHQGLHGVFPTVVVATLVQLASSQSGSPKCSLSVPCSRYCSLVLVARTPCALPPTVGVAFWPSASVCSSPMKCKREGLSSSVSETPQHSPLLLVLAITLYSTIPIYRTVTRRFVRTDQSVSYYTFAHFSANQRAITILHC